jgi:hypothetical protein
MEYLLRQINTSISHRPSFIRTGNMGHDVAMGGIISIINIISELIQTDFKTDRQIKHIYNRYDRIVEDLCELCETSLVSEVLSYIYGLIDYFLEISIQRELYESASNIVKFKEEDIKILQ